MPDFLHERRDFGELVGVVSGERGIKPVPVEIPHTLEFFIARDRGFKV